MKYRSLPPEEYRANIDALTSKFEGVEAGSLKPRPIFSELVEAMGGLFGGVWQESFDRDWWFFRVRTRSSFADEKDMFLPAQHSYPPAEYCAAGRCNLPNRPVFYGTNSWECAMEEMKIPEENRYILSLWRLPPKPLKYSKFLCGSNIQSGRLWPHKEGILRDGFSQSRIDPSDPLNGTRLKAFMECWSDLFLSPNYTISTAISETLFSDGYAEQCDLIAFGSAVFPDGTNFALPPKTADKMKLHRVFDIERRPDGKTACKGCFDPGEKEWHPVAVHDAPIPGGDPALASSVRIG